jgi:hypothetical protein
MRELREKKGAKVSHTKKKYLLFKVFISFSYHIDSSEKYNFILLENPGTITSVRP